MSIIIVNPLEYPGWDELLLDSGNHSFFHTAVWARCLKESYGYKPVYHAGFSDGHMSFLMPFMEITSHLTGKRGVSLPLTDHCGLFGTAEDPYGEVIRAVIDFGRQAKWKYAEWRGVEIPRDIRISTESFLTHDIDLTKSEEEIFSSLRENNRRNIKRAYRTGIKVEFGTGPDSLAQFYRINCTTRRRHGLPPQPMAFFKNMLRHIILPGYGVFVEAQYQGSVVASAVFFQFGKAAIYKYGASDPKYLIHRPNNIILWEAIKLFKARGITTLNLGRTELDNVGLAHYKRSWNADERLLKYCRFNYQKRIGLSPRLSLRRRNCLLTSMPMIALRIIGRMFYKHMD